MAKITASLTVTVRMSTGELRAGLELRAVTEQDRRDLAGLINTAKQCGLYNDQNKVLGFDSLSGYDLYWPGLGVDDAFSFESIPCGNWANGKWRVLFMSNPCSFVEEPDDLSETCLCQNEHSCQTCRLQKKLKSIGHELLSVQNIEARLNDRAAWLLQKLEQYEKKYGKLHPQNGEVEQVEEDNGVGEEDDEGVEDEGAWEGKDRTALQRALHRRAQTAEVENGNLLAEIVRLKGENKELHQKLSAQHVKGRGGYTKTMEEQEKTAKKHQRHSCDEDEEVGADSDEEPPFKRHRSAARAPGRAVEGRDGGRKTGLKTYRPQKSTKMHHETSDQSDDESFIPSSQGPRQSCFSRSAGRASATPKAIQTIAKTGRHTNNSMAGFLDTFESGSLTPGSRNAPDTFASGGATSDAMSAFMDNESDSNTSETPKAAPSAAIIPATTSTPTVTNPTQTGAALAASAPENPVQAAAAGNRAQGWTDNELQALINLVRAHRNTPVGPNGKRPKVLHDVRLFDLMSRQLQAQGIHRSAGACKNEWNRRGRRVSGIDNRKVANPGQMATSLQRTD